MAYEVQTPVFEGPFDLLLHLITKEQVDLYEVSLSRIVDVYLVELDRMKKASADNGLDLEVATEFLLIAAVLVELKSRRLLPNTADPDLEEELALWEERDLLLSRLLECKTFKDAASEFDRLSNEAKLSMPHVGMLEEPYLSIAPDILAGATPGRLKDVMDAMLTPKPAPKVELDHVAPVRVSVQDAVGILVNELPRNGTSTFRQLTSHVHERLEVIVRFLAVLEMYKQGLVEIEQTTNFGELSIRWTGDNEVDLHEIPIEVYEG